MVGLDPNIKILGEIRISIDRGESFKSTLHQFCRENPSKLAQQLASLLISHQQGKDMYDFVHTQSGERSLVLNLIWRGLQGEAITKHLSDLEIELEEAGKRQLEQFSQVLPIKVLLAVMIFQFPALLILALLPILDRLLEAVK